MGTDSTKGYDNSCALCHTQYITYGYKRKWYYYNKFGPVCEECNKKGVEVTIYEDKRPDKVVKGRRSKW